MARDGSGLVRAIRTLHDVGSLAGLEDVDLLRVFLDRGEASSAAFEAIVTRHAAMVMGVCRAVVGSEADAEDAFQATFLVLACRAGKVRNRASLGPWLFGVARRLATRARTNAARRRAVERCAAGSHATTCPAIEPDDAIATLIEEVDRLPARYRDPLVLCHLQGMTYEAAARRLACPVGTLSVRIRRAKERLRTTLKRRGVNEASALAAFPGAVVPGPLASSTAHLASLVAPALVKTGVPASVLSLTRGALTTMRIQPIAASSVAFLALAAGAWAWRASAAIDEPPPRSAAGASEEAKPARYQLTGRVADEEGQPAQGAVIQVLTRDPVLGRAVVKKAVSGADGTYTIDLPPGHVQDASIIPPPGCLDSTGDVPSIPFALSNESPLTHRDFTVKRGSGWAFRLTKGGGSISKGAVGAISAISGGEVESRNVSPYAECSSDGRAVLGLPRRKGEAELRAATIGGFAQYAQCLIRWDDRFHPESVRSVTRLDGEPVRFWATDRDGRSALLEARSDHRIEPRIEDGRLVIHVDVPGDTKETLPVFAGTVVDGTGKSVAGARIDAVYVEGDTSYMGEGDGCTTTTDEAGHFQLGRLPATYWGRRPDAIRLAVTRDGFASVDTPSIPLDGKGRPTETPIVLAPGCSVTGVILGLDGKPVEGVQIEPNGSFALRSRQAWTDAEGRFTVTGLPDGEIGLFVRYGELTTGGPELVTASRDPRPVAIRLKKR